MGPTNKSLTSKHWILFYVLYTTYYHIFYLYCIYLCKCLFLRPCCVAPLCAMTLRTCITPARPRRPHKLNQIQSSNCPWHILRVRKLQTCYHMLRVHTNTILGVAWLKNIEGSLPLCFLVNRSRGKHRNTILESAGAGSSAAPHDPHFSCC